MLLRYIKISLSFSVAAWGLIAGTMNLIYYNLGPVAAVMTMEGQDSVRAVSSPILFTIGYAFIYLGKYATGILAALGTHHLWVSRSDASHFNSAKSRVLAGCGAGIFTLFFGFYVMANSVFSSGGPSELSSAYLSYALYYIGALGIIALFIAIPDSDHDPSHA